MFLPGPIELLLVSIVAALLWYRLRRLLPEAAASLRAQLRAQGQEHFWRQHAVYLIVLEKAARYMAIFVALATLVVLLLLLCY